MLVGQTPGGPGWSEVDWQKVPIWNGNGNGTAKPPAPAQTHPFDPRGAFQIPNNFWGFAMLLYGMK